MSLISDLFSSSVGVVIREVGNVIDNLSTSDEEKLKLRNELFSAEMNYNLKLKKIEVEHQKELSLRHSNDMRSDSWLSKNVRPVMLIFLVGVITFLSISDSIEIIRFDVKESYIDLFQILLITSFSFYFGGRSIEKAVKIKKGENEKS